GDLRLVNGGQQSVVHRYAFSLRVRSVRSRTARPKMVPAFMPGTVRQSVRTRSRRARVQQRLSKRPSYMGGAVVAGEARDGHRPCAQQRRNHLETAATSARLVAPADTGACVLVRAPGALLSNSKAMPVATA